LHNDGWLTAAIPRNDWLTAVIAPA
jgi:hypothetical protein